MKILTYIIVVLCSIFVGCNEYIEDVQQDSKAETVKIIEGLTPLSVQWTQDSTTYWTRTGEDSTWKELQANDTLTFPEYTIIETYRKTLQNNLRVKKVIDIDPKTKTKISESDIYIRQINQQIESRLSLSYNYKTVEYYAHFLDSTGTNEKRKANRANADNLLKTADQEGLYLCGTAYNAIIWKDIPFLPIPRKIDKDSALFVIEQWTKK